MSRPLAYAQGNDLMVHAGVVPQWSVAQTLELAAAVSATLQHDPRGLFEHMYGDEPDRWDEKLRGMERLRFTINVLTRIRVCTADGRVDLSVKGPPPPPASPLRPWFEHPGRRSREARVIFGHWSALGFVRRAGSHRPGQRLRLGRHAHRVRPRPRARAARHALRAVSAHQCGLTAAGGDGACVAAAPQDDHDLRSLGRVQARR